jgi:hypothetical protein
MCRRRKLTRALELAGGARFAHQPPWLGPSVFHNTAAAGGQRSGARTRLGQRRAASQRRRQAHGVDLVGRPGPIGARRQVCDEAGSRRGLGRRGTGRGTGDCPNVRAGRCRARGRACQLDSGAGGGVDGAAPGRDVDRRREDCKRTEFRAGGGRTRQGWGDRCRRRFIRSCSKAASPRVRLCTTSKLAFQAIQVGQGHLSWRGDPSS